MRWPPHLLQYCRRLSLVFWNIATCSAPAVIRTAPGFHSVKAFTGPPGDTPAAAGIQRCNTDACSGLFFQRGKRRAGRIGKAGQQHAFLIGL